MSTFNVYRRLKGDNSPALIASGLTDKSYIDTTAVSGVTYEYSVSAVKNSVEKMSDIIQVSTGDAYFNDVDLLIIADTEANSYTDYSLNARIITKQGSILVEQHDGKKCIKFSGNSFIEWNTTNGRLISDIAALGTGDYTLETVAAYPATQAGGARIWEIGTENSNRSTILPAGNVFNGELLLNNAIKGTFNNIYFDGVLRNHCLMRKNGITAYYVAGVKILETSDVIDITTANRITIGTAIPFNGPLQGWVHALRLTKAARYDANGFTPDSEFPKF